MRKTIFCCLFGLVSTGCLAGCGFFQNLRNDCCAIRGQCSKDCAPKKTTASVDADKRDDSAYIKTTKGVRPGLFGTLKAPSKTTGKEPAVVKPMPPVPPKIQTESIDPDRLPEVPGNLSKMQPDQPLKIDIVPMECLPLKHEPTPDRIQSAANLTSEPPMCPTMPNVVVTPSREIVSDSPKVGEKAVAYKNVHITYGPSNQFKTVTGLVQQYRKTWRLRYAAVDQEDRYGGVVVLEGSAELSQLRDGKHIRVTGTLIAPEDRASAARYRVNSVEVLD